MKSFLRRVWQRLRGTPGHPARAAIAVAIGLFIGVQPIYGLHLVLIMAICVPLRLDALLAYLVANISNPLVAPFLIFSEVETGAYLKTGQWARFDIAQARATGAAGFAQQLFVGSFVVGAALAALGFALGYVVAARRKSASVVAEASPELLFDAACDRTRARYRGAPTNDRCYVAGKLAFDPVFKLVLELPGSFGRVLDLGCGRGQLSLLLLELGRATHVVGIDSDARKVDIASAAGPEAEFRAGDLAGGELAQADTILLIDVLHYMPLAEQDALLSAAANALAPGGRLLVRELNAVAGARSGFTRFMEFWARKTGLNKGRATHYRPARELCDVLEHVGLASSVQGASERTPFGNVLIVAGGSPSVKLEPAASPSSTRMSAAKA